MYAYYDCVLKLIRISSQDTFTSSSWFSPSIYWIWHLTVSRHIMFSTFAQTNTKMYGISANKIVGEHLRDDCTEWLKELGRLYHKYFYSTLGLRKQRGRGGRDLGNFFANPWRSWCWMISPRRVTKSLSIAHKSSRGSMIRRWQAAYSVSSSTMLLKCSALSRRPGD